MLCFFWYATLTYILEYDKRVETYTSYQENITSLKAEITQIEENIAKVEKDESLSGPQAIAKVKELFERKEEVNEELMVAESEFANLSYAVPNPTKLKIDKFLIFFSLE